MKNTFKKVFAVVTLAAMLVACFAGCQPSAANGKVLVIGGSGPLTGDYATYGTSVKQGAEIAVEEINAAGGVNGITFKFSLKDDESDPAKATSAYNMLMDEGMQVSLGGVTSGASLAAAEESKKDGILLVTPSASQKECVQYDNCFRICFTDPDQGTYSADFIANNKLATKVAIIYDNSNDYSKGIRDTFVSQAGKVGLQVVADEAFTSDSNTDFSTQLTAVKNSGATLLFMPIYAQEAASILTQAKGVLTGVTFFGCDGLDGVLQKIDDPKNAEGVMLLTPFAADAQDDLTKTFVQKYQQKYNATPDQFAADGYDAIYAIAAALEEAGITDTTDKDLNAKLIAAMTKINVVGLTGDMTWSADGECVKTATAVVITDGKYVAYSK